jgi:hypothetical protein
MTGPEELALVVAYIEHRANSLDGTVEELKHRLTAADIADFKGRAAGYRDIARNLKKGVHRIKRTGKA